MPTNTKDPKQPTNKQSPQERAAQVKAEKNDEDQLSVLRLIARDLKASVSKKGSGFGKTISNTAGTITDAAMQEVPGLQFITGLAADAKSYAAGVASRLSRPKKSTPDSQQETKEEKEKPTRGRPTKERQKSKDSTRKEQIKQDSSGKEQLKQSTDLNSTSDKILDELKQQTELLDDKKHRDEIDAARDKNTPVQSSMVPKKEKEKPKNILDLLKNNLGGILAGLGSFFGMLAGGLLKFLPRILLDLAGGLPKLLLLGIPILLSKFSDEITHFFTGGGMEDAIKSIIPSLNNIGKEVSAAFTRISDKFSNLWDDFSIGGLFDALGSTASNLVGLFGIDINKVGSALSSTFEGLSKAVFYTIGGLAGYSIDDMQKFWENDFKPMIGQSLLDMVNWVDNVFDSVSNFFTSISDKWNNFSMSKFVEDSYKSVKDFMTKSISGMIEFIAQGVKDIPLVGGTIYKFLTGRDKDVDDAYTELNQKVSAGQIKVDSPEYKKELEKIAILETEADKPLAQKAKEGAVAAYESTKNTVKEKASAGYQSVKDTAGNIAGKVSSWFSGGDKTSLSEVAASKDNSIFTRSGTARSKGIPNNLPQGEEGETVDSNLTRLKDTIVKPLAAAFPGAQMSSAFRSDEVNGALGGAAGSDHREGRAIDLSVKGVEPAQLAAGINKMGIPYDKLIVEPSWVHLSIPKDGQKPAMKMLNATRGMFGKMSYASTSAQSIQKAAGLNPGDKIPGMVEEPPTTPSAVIANTVTAESSAIATPGGPPGGPLGQIQATPSAEAVIPEATNQLNTQVDGTKTQPAPTNVSSSTFAPSTVQSNTVIYTKSDSKVNR